jgi:regulator of sigma E protease
MLFSIILFIIVLAVLILVHEFGHFIVAKRNGIRVDEFGLGFPPRLFGFTKGETTYSLNAIPFGGFVKIHGENPDEDSISGPDQGRSMVNKPKRVQAAVLVAGVAFNILLAWMLFVIGFMSGLPTSMSEVPPGAQVNELGLMITSVMPNSPAEEAGVKPGDRILAVETPAGLLDGPAISEVQDAMAAHGGQEVILSVERGIGERAEALSLEVIPEEGLAAGRAGIGVTMDQVGIMRLPFFSAIWEGTKFTVRITGVIAVALWDFFSQLFRGQADLSTVAGPVGLVGLVGDASQLGFIYLLSFTALISINLALINLIPFPALDGGRLLFLFIEWLKGSPISPKVANTLNFVGFALLITLMLVITFSDITRIIG